MMKTTIISYLDSGKEITFCKDEHVMALIKHKKGEKSMNEVFLTKYDFLYTLLRKQ